MSKRIRVEVTKQDIRLGKRCVPEYCAIARAACRAFGVSMSSRKLQVGLSSIMLGGRWFAMPNRAMKFIERLDAKKSVKPITFYATEYFL